MDPQTSQVVLVGVVSYVLGSNTTLCASNNTDHPANIYTRVVSVLPWIQNITGNCNAAEHSHSDYDDYNL